MGARDPRGEIKERRSPSELSALGVYYTQFKHCGWNIGSVVFKGGVPRIQSYSATLTLLTALGLDL